MSGAVVLIKLGGSLITDKTRPAVVRTRVLGRLARELATARGANGPAWVLGHGSGSFGHVPARRHRLAEGLGSPKQLQGVAETQDLAWQLHRRVIAALRRVGLATFGFAAGSAFLATEGRLAAGSVEPVVAALGAGLLPVVFGDVVMDSERGVSIASTETILLLLAERLAARGRPVTRVLWVGATDGLLDDAGRPVPVVDRRSAAELEGLVGETRGTDVTGGMRHRLDAALRLADAGVESWIVDGSRAGVLAAALAGRLESGTRVRAH